MKLSIVIPTYNRPNSIKKLLESIKIDKTKCFEVIISDDNSDIDKFQEVKKLESENVKVYRNQFNLGMVKNWNQCIHYACGDWILFCCDDDIFLPNSLDRIFSIIDNAKHEYLIIQNEHIDQEIQEISFQRDGISEFKLPIVSGTIWHKNISSKLGNFDEQIKYSPDAEIWYRFGKYYPILMVKNRFVNFIHHDDNYEYKTWLKKDFIEQVELISRKNYLLIGEYLENRVTENEYIYSSIKETIDSIIYISWFKFNLTPVLFKYLLIGLKHDNNKLNFIVKFFFKLPIKKVYDFIILRKNKSASL